ncbi:MAG: ADP-glyceromanno-heptose 6-epimerase [Myxococcota bacterium]
MIIVTGATGFIGSNVVLDLNARGENEVLAVDVLDSPTKHRNLNRAEIVDLVGPDELLAQLDGLNNVSMVLHQGACSDTTESDGVFMMRNNYRYSITLAKWCMARDIPFVYASSAAIYGNGDGGFAEARPAENPLNVYAYSKFLFDQWVRRNVTTQKVVGLRYFNVYGPQEHHKGRMASVVFKFHQQVKAGKPLTVFEGSDKFVRDFVYVGDVSDVNMHFVEHPDRTGIYNVGCGKARSFMDLAELVARRYGAKIDLVPFPADLEGKYQTFTQADITRLRKSGYDKPFTELEDGVNRYLDLLDSQDGWR